MISADGTTVTGTAEPGSTVTIRENGVKVGKRSPTIRRNFSVDLIPPKANGEALTADATDTAGNTGPTAPFDAPDITAAQTPVITGVVDDAPASPVLSARTVSHQRQHAYHQRNGRGLAPPSPSYSGTTEIGTTQSCRRTVSGPSRWKPRYRTAGTY